MNITGKLFFLGLLACFIGCTQHSDERQVAIRIGYFPNITHSQALIGFSAARGDFQKNFGDSVSQISPLKINSDECIIETDINPHAQKIRLVFLAIADNPLCSPSSIQIEEIAYA